MAGPVVHQLELVYDETGILMSGRELIVPDDSPGTLPDQLNHGCGSKCLAADIRNVGTFDTATGQAPCAF